MSDLISRQAVLNILKGMMWSYGGGTSISDEGKHIHNETLAEAQQAVCDLPSAEKTATVSLAVYKQVARERDIAIKQLNDLGYEFGEKIRTSAEKTAICPSVGIDCEDCPAYPSAEKTGHWINDECGNVICSECKRFRRDCRYGHTNYCNHCGAHMAESEDKE